MFEFHMYVAGFVGALGLLLVLPSFLLLVRSQRILHGWVALLSLILIAGWTTAALMPEGADEMHAGYERAVQYAVLELTSLGFALSILLAWATGWLLGRGK